MIPAFSLVPRRDHVNLSCQRNFVFQARGGPYSVEARFERHVDANHRSHSFYP